MEANGQKWENKRAVGAVYSISCQKDVQAGSGTTTLTPCERCLELRDLHAFQVTINRRMPDENKMKFVPKGYRCKELGDIYLKYPGVRSLVELDDGRSPWLRFAQGAADGVYKSQGVLLGMVEAMVKKSERLRKGKTMKNMSYGRAFNDFCNILASTSSRAYRTFKQHFGGRGLRSMREIRAKQPRFQAGISWQNIGLAAVVLNKLNYHGPLALSWDDTALQPALTIYQESKEKWLVLGSTTGPSTVTAVDDLDDVLDKAGLEKAEKLRVWLLTIPLPKIPPIMIAAVARGSCDSAPQLKDMHTKVTAELQKAGIYPLSLSCDGTEVERSLQRLVAESADDELRYEIPSKVPGCTIKLRIPLFNGRPSIGGQDSKHGLKTARNQLLTGARFLVQGNHVIHFHQLREMAENVLGPLFKRDVEKVDKQDDYAAARLFSSACMKFQTQTYSHHTALTTYLFIMGELIDAWQNRSLRHIERAKMVMRARFFLMAWRTHVDQHPDHSVHVQFISRESYDIFNILCESLLSLIIASRQFFPRYPLLPWLHSTEPCEHLFGMLRQLKKDFNYADVLHLEPKLRVLMMGAFGDLSPEEQTNQTAAGYHHTYFRADDLDLAALMEWPTDSQLQEASTAAFKEAEQLLGALGIKASPMLAACHKDRPLPRANAANITSKPCAREPQSLWDILRLYQGVSLPTKAEDAVEACEMALAAQDVDSSLAIDTLPDSSEGDLKELSNNIGEQLSAVQGLGPTTVPASNTPGTSVRASIMVLSLVDVESKQLNTGTLVDERARHEPKWTVKAVRQRGRSFAPSPRVPVGKAVEKSADIRRALVQRLADHLSSADSQGVTTGVDRQVRYTGTFTMQSTDARTRNKATIQQVASDKFLRMREKAFATIQDVHANMYSANITPYNCLEPGRFIIAWHPGKRGGLVIGKVITMYSKTGTKHDWVSSITSVGMPSYVNIQVYGAFVGNTLSTVACPSLGCATFLRIPATHIVMSLASANIKETDFNTSDGNPVRLATLCSWSEDIVKKLEVRSLLVGAAVKQLKKLLRQKQVPQSVEASNKVADPNVANPNVANSLDADESEREDGEDGEESEEED